MYHAENVAIALIIAIRQREQEEQDLEYGVGAESALLAGWRMMLEDLKKARWVQVKP